MPEFVEVAAVSDFKSGEAKTVEVNGLQIALYNVNGKFYASTNVCPHRSGPLGDGMLEGETITCPMHGWQFNVKNGEYVVVPTIKIETYETKVENGKVFVRI